MIHTLYKETVLPGGGASTVYNTTAEKKSMQKHFFIFLFEESRNKVSDRSEKILAWLLKACFYPSFSACYSQWNLNVRTVQYPPIGLPLTILFYEMIET